MKLYAICCPEYLIKPLQYFINKQDAILWFNQEMQEHWQEHCKDSRYFEDKQFTPFEGLKNYGEAFIDRIDLKFIAVWCEYNISGQFGVDSDQTILQVNSQYSEKEIDEKVLAYLSKACDMPPEELEQGSLWDWECIFKIDSI